MVKVQCKGSCGKLTGAKSGLCQECTRKSNAERCARKCDDCPDPVGRAGYRLCIKCEKVKLKELQSSGHLTNAPRIGTTRSGEQMENTRDTKFGRD